MVKYKIRRGARKAYTVIRGRTELQTFPTELSAKRFVKARRHLDAVQNKVRRLKRKAKRS